MKSRLDILDIARFFAAFSVIYYHYLYRGWRADGLNDLTFNFYDGFFKYGYLGVQFFFLISGFVISMSMEKKSATKFFIGRVVRLYPAFLFSVTLTFLVILLFDDGRFGIDFFVYILNLTMISKAFGIEFVDGAYWTLIYELIFYFWCFVSLYFKKVHLSSFLILFMLLSFFARLIGFNSYYSAMWCGDFIFYFSAGYFFYKAYIFGFSLKYNSAIFITFLGCLMQLYFQVESKNGIPGVLISFYSVSFIVFMFFIFFYLICYGKGLNFTFKYSYILGGLTYPSYLIHQNIGYIFFNNSVGIINQWLALLAVSVFVFSTSYIVFRYIEPKVGYLMKNMLEKSLGNIRHV